MRAAFDAASLLRVREILAACGLPGIVLTTPAAVAWATGGLSQPVDRSAVVDPVWVAVAPDGAVLLTTNVEAPRLAADSAAGTTVPADVIVSVPWWDSGQLVDAAASALGVPPAALGSDGHPAFGADLTHELTVARLRLSGSQQDGLRDLAAGAALVVEAALRSWRPGEADRGIAARIAAGVEDLGGQCPVLIVGGDDRVVRFRHPLAVGAPVRDLVMAVLVASRGGQHVALTRFASNGPVPAGLAASFDVVRQIQRDTLGACTGTTSLGSAMTVLADSYARHGHDGAWADHYQGGPIGYAQREVELAPVERGNRWWDVCLPTGSAVAFNPSVAGGAKDEDTFLLGATGPEWITRTSDWPLDDDHHLPRPTVLDITA